MLSVYLTESTSLFNRKGEHPSLRNQAARGFEAPGSPLAWRQRQQRPVSGRRDLLREGFPTKPLNLRRELLPAYLADFGAKSPGGDRATAGGNSLTGVMPCRNDTVGLRR